VSGAVTLTTSTGTFSLTTTNRHQTNSREATARCAVV
jgi:hypothetical protein